MNVLDLFYSFRTRLLLVLAILLVTTLGVQYYIYYRFNVEVARIIAEQEQAVGAGFALAMESVPSTDRLVDLQARYRQELLTAEAGPVANILIVDDEGLITDSLDPEYNPKTRPDGTKENYKLADIRLPPLVDTGVSMSSLEQLPGINFDPSPPEVGAPRAVPLRFEALRNPVYIIVVLGSGNEPVNASPSRVARLLLPTLAVLSLAILATTLLVWRFTQPIQDLSEAARRASIGDFSYRVPLAGRRDEMGALALTFNRMIERVGHMRELEGQLHHAERSAVVGRLASAIAHEIRNPLNYINLTLDHLRTSLAPEEPDKRQTFLRLADGVKTEVARINTRISEFLKYTRPSRLTLRPLDLRAEIDDALRLVETQAAENNIELKIEQRGSLPLVLGDADSLRSVFTNLIINSLQAIDDKTGQLTIDLSATANGEVVTRITDTGPGISQENMSQIFEPYFSTKDTGTGLGLAIVKKAIDDHHGRIEVESTPGAGTTFIVTLPTADAGGQMSDVSSDTNSPALT